MDSTHPEERVRRMIKIIVYVNLMSSNYLEGKVGFAHGNCYLTLLCLIQIKVILDKSGFSNKISITYSLICGRYDNTLYEYFQNFNNLLL